VATDETFRFTGTQILGCMCVNNKFLPQYENNIGCLSPRVTSPSFLCAHNVIKLILYRVIAEIPAQLFLWQFMKVTLNMVQSKQWFRKCD